MIVDALTKGAAMGLGLESVLRDWGLTYKIVLKTDSCSSIGTSQRRGAGKLRHIHTPYLWLQQLVRMRGVTFTKELGNSNIADIGTKIFRWLDVANCREL